MRSLARIFKPEPETQLERYRDVNIDLARENQELKLTLYVMAGLFLLFLLARR